MASEALTPRPTRDEDELTREADAALVRHGIPVPPAGRAPGTPNKVTRIARAKALKLIESEEYMASVVARIRLGTLPPAVETMLWHYAFGRPKTVVEVSALDSSRRADLSSLTDEQLAERAAQMANELRGRAERVNAIDVTPTKECG